MRKVTPVARALRTRRSQSIQNAINPCLEQLEYRRLLAGDLDLSFGVGGKRVESIGVNDTLEAVTTDSLGRLIAAGTSDSRFAVTRFTTGGALDTSFNSTGKVTTTIGSLASATSVQHTAAGVLVGGFSFAVPANNLDFTLARYTSSGSLDGTFGVGGIVSTNFGASSADQIFAVAVQSDGKIVAVGSAAGDIALARYNPNGTLDGTFGVGGLVKTDIGASTADTANAVVIDAMGRIVVAGTSNGDVVVARYTAAGALDTGFNDTGKFVYDLGTAADVASGVAFDGMGRLIVSASSGADVVTMRLMSTGALDASYAFGGVATTAIGPGANARNVVIQPYDGRIVVVASVANDVKLIRYNANGSLDANFGTGGVVTTDVGSGSVDSVGAVAYYGTASTRRLLVGATSNGNFAAMSYDANIAPVIATNTAQTVGGAVQVTANGSRTLSAAILASTDADNGAAELVYTVTTGPANGQIRVNGVPASTFTQADLNANLVTYKSNGTLGADAFQFALADGFGGAVTGLPANTVNLNVTAAPALVYVNDNWAALLDGALVSDSFQSSPFTNFTIGVDAFGSISEALSLVAAGGTIRVLAGTYTDTVVVNKQVHFVGEGASLVTVFGKMDGVNQSAFYFPGASNGSSIRGFTITREGNNLTDWNNPLLKTAAIGVQGASGIVITENVLTGNRTGLDLNNVNNITVEANVIDNNRTGMIMRNAVTNSSIQQNYVTNNWTAGVLVLVGGAGENFTGSVISGNAIYGNWDVQIENRSLAGGPKNFSGNWLGTVNPTAVAADIMNAGYGSLIPVAFGGTSTPPVGAPTAAGAGLSELDFTPFLASGVDTNPSAMGFQGDFSTLIVTTLGGQSGSVGRVNEAIGAVNLGGTVLLANGTYDETVLVNRSITLKSQNTLGATITRTVGSQQTLVTVNALNVTIESVNVEVNQTSAVAPVGIGGVFTEFDGLLLKGNSITSVGDNLTGNWTGSPSLSVRAAGIVLYDSPSGGIPKITLEDNTVNILSGTSFFQRAVWLAQVQANITGNTFAGASNDLQFQFASGGPSLIDNNNFVGQHRGGGAGLVLAEPNPNSPVTISNNNFASVGGDPANVQSALQINLNAHTTSPVLVTGNTFTGHVIGVASNNSQGVTIEDNIFTPRAGLANLPALEGDFAHIAVNSQLPNNAGVTSIANSAIIRDNTFNSAAGSEGTAVLLDSSLAGATYAPAGIQIGVGTANTYDADLITGVRARGGVATISDTIASLDNAVVVAGGSTTVTGSTLTGNTVGVLSTGGSVTIANTSFDGATDNTTDVDITATGSVTFGNNVTFAGDSFYIDNKSAASQNLAALSGIAFDQSSNYRIEDRMYHRVDVDRPAVGLITWVANNLYVTQPATGTTNDSSIQQGINAALDGFVVNVENGTYGLSSTINVDKPVTVLGQSAGNVLLRPDTTLAALMLVGGGSLNGDLTDDVTINQINFNGNNTGIRAAQGVLVLPSADFDTLTVQNGTFTALQSQGVAVYGTTATGLSVDNVVLDGLSFSSNGQNAGGSGDINIYDYNGNVSLSNLTHTGGAAGSRFAIQLRGKGYSQTSDADMLASGNVAFNNVDITGSYRNYGIFVTAYRDVSSMSFTDVKLGSASSQLTGTWGAWLRFDGVGTVPNASVNLGNTLFRGMTGPNAYTEVYDLEFAPDKTSAFFLSADATTTQWDLGSVVNASALTLSQALAVEDRILHFVDKLNPTHGLTFGAYKGFAEITPNQAYVTARPDVDLSGNGSINRGVQIVPVGGIVNVGPGNFTENVVVDKNVSLLSTNGRAATTIAGINGAGALGTIQITNNTTAVKIGNTSGRGFTVVGIDNNDPGLENAAVYFQGPHSGAEIRNNEIVANGDHGLLTEYGQTITGFVIDSNIFSGQTFVGPQPADNGFANQFSTPNVPRQLVTMGAGTGSTSTSNITFTNNQITGTAGGTNVGGEQGNTLVTLDAANSLIAGNTFSGTTTRFGHSLRVRSPNTTIEGNTFNSTTMTAGTVDLYLNGTGLVARDNTFAGSAGTAISLDTAGSATLGGPAVSDGNAIAGYDVGVFVRGTATLANNNFNGATDNLVDVRLASGAPAATFGIGNLFAGDNYFIENLSGVSYNLTTYTATNFEGLTNNFQIEDRLYHAPDSATSGLITWVSGNLFVTTPGTGASDETIQRAIDAASSGNTVNVQAGTYLENLIIAKDLILLGANQGVNPNTAVRNPESIITGGIVVDNAAPRDVDVLGFTFNGTAGPLAYNNNFSTGLSRILFKNNIASGTGQLSAFLGIVGASLELNVEQNRFLSTTSNAAQIGGTAGAPLSVVLQDNVVIGTVNAGFNLDTISDSLISGNEISNTGQQGIQLAGASGDVSVSGNTITNANTGNATDRGAIRLRPTGFTGPVAITGNTISNSFNAITIASGENIAGKAVTIDGNIVTTTGAPLAGRMFIRHNGAGAIDLTTSTNTVNGIAANASATTADLFGIEDVVYHALDNASSGLVSIKPGHLFVTTPGTGASDETIQRAINAASSGHTINVQAGTFAEALTVNKTLTFRGANAGVDPTGRMAGSSAETVVVAPAGQNAFNLLLGANNVLIDGFDITGNGAGLQGIAIQNASGLNVLNNFVRDFPSSIGVAFGAGVNNSLVRYNSFSDSYAGVYLSANANNITVRDNDFIGHGPDGDVVLEGNNDNITIRNNRFNSVATPGVFTFAGYGNSYDNVTILENAFLGSAGILNNDASSQLDASFNWFNANGAAAVAAKVVGNVDYNPWLVDAFDTQVAVSGFQPVVDDTATDSVFFTGAAVTNEGASYTLTLNNTNDPDIGTVLSWSIDWGDSTSDVFVGAAGVINHTYLDGPGSYSITGTVTTTLGTYTVQIPLAVTVNNVAPTIVSAIAPTTASEGQTVTVDVDFIDPAGTNDNYSYSYTITKNGNPYASGTNIALPGGPAAFDFSFVPDDDGSYVVSVTVTDSDGAVSNIGNATVNVGNVAPVITSLTAPSPVNEGDLVTVDVDFVDPALAEDTYTYSYTITKNANPYASGTDIPLAGVGPFSFTFTPDDNATYVITVTVKDSDGGVSLTEQTTVIANNVAPTVPLSGAATVNEGGTYTLTIGAPVDPGTDTITTYIINWGDGSTPTTISAAALASLSGVLTHTYLDGPGGVTQISVSVVDEDGLHTNAGVLPLSVINLNPTGTLTGSASVPAFSTGIVTWLSPSDPSSVDAGSLRYVYDFNNDGVWDLGNPVYGGAGFSTSSTVIVPASFLTTPGLVTVKSRILDKDGGFVEQFHNITVTPVTFRVISLTPTVSGFTMTFNGNVDPTVLNLYGPSASDLIVTRDGNPVRGSIVFDNNPTKIHFVSTGGPLANGTYVIQAKSGSSAFRNTGGDLLDGNADNTAGDDYFGNFVVNNAAGTRTLTMADFSRGPGQNVNLPAPATGAPITLSNGNGVYSVGPFAIKFDPTQLTVSNVTLAAGLPGDWNITVNLADAANGVVYVTAFGTTPLTAGPKQIAIVHSAVPGSATYGKASKVRIVGVDNVGNEVAQVNVNGNTVPTIGDNAVHSGNYVGDADRSGLYDGFDASLIAQASVLLINGFQLYPTTDPIIVGDADGNALIDGFDASLVAQKSILLPVPQIPDIPVSPRPWLPDVGDEQFGTSMLQMRSSIAAATRVSVPVGLVVDSQTERPAALMLEVRFDPRFLSIDALTGVVATSAARSMGLNFLAHLVEPGLLRVLAFGPLTMPTFAGDLFNLDFQTTFNERNRLGFSTQVFVRGVDQQTQNLLAERSTTITSTPVRNPVRPPVPVAEEPTGDLVPMTPRVFSEVGI